MWVWRDSTSESTGVAVNGVIAIISTDDVLPEWLSPPLLAVAAAGCLASLGAGVVALRVRYRRGDEVTREQVRWLLLGAGTVPVLLAVGWVLQSLGASPSVAYSGFLVMMLLAVPAAVVVAVLRHDLFDVDRLLGSSLAWLLTTIVSAAAPLRWSSRPLAWVPTADWV